MPTQELRLIDSHGAVLHAPLVRAEPNDLQRARLEIVRAIADAEEVLNPRLRRALLRSLFLVAQELGCAVCGLPIKLNELETCDLTRRSLVHLWGGCSDQLAKALQMSGDDVLRGKCWP